MGDGFNRRQVLGALGAGVTGSLAGCNQALEPKDDQTNDPNSNGSQDKPQEIGITDAPNPNLSNVDLNRHEGDTYGLSFTRDTADLEGDVTVQVTNGVQEQVYETTADEIAKLDNRAAINLPETLFTHGDSILSVEFHDEDIEAPLQARINTQTPSAFPIDRRVEGEQASNFETPWAFAQHDLEREKARQAHLNYVNEKWVREPIVDESLYDGTHGLGEEYDERINQIKSMDPNTEMLEIIELAGRIGYELEGDRDKYKDTIGDIPTGTTQSGHEIGHGAAQIIRDIHNIDLKTIVTTRPDTNKDSILQYNPETGDVIWEGVRGTTRDAETHANQILEDGPLKKSMIYGFEPGEVEGIDDSDASQKTYNAQASIMSMANQERIDPSNYVMNDYFLAEVSDQIFEEGNVQAVNDIASDAAEMAIATDQLTFQEARDPEDSMPAREATLENGKIAVYIDEDESLEDATLAYVQDENLGSNLYDRVVETAEPAGRNEIEEIVGLN